MKSNVVTRNSRKDVMVIIFNDECDQQLFWVQIYIY